MCFCLGRLRVCPTQDIKRIAILCINICENYTIDASFYLLMRMRSQRTGKYCSFCATLLCRISIIHAHGLIETVSKDSSKQVSHQKKHHPHIFSQVFIKYCSQFTHSLNRHHWYRDFLRVAGAAIIVQLQLEYLCMRTRVYYVELRYESQIRTTFYQSEVFLFKCVIDFILQLLRVVQLSSLRQLPAYHLRVVFKPVVHCSVLSQLVCPQRALLL